MVVALIMYCRYSCDSCYSWLLLLILVLLNLEGKSVELLYKDEAYKIIGACFEVYNEMGCGFVEPVYQECLRGKPRITRITRMRKREDERRRMKS